MQFQGFDFSQFFYSHFADKNETGVLKVQDQREKPVICTYFRIYIHNYTFSSSPYSVYIIRNGQKQAASWTAKSSPLQSWKANNNLAGSISTCPCILPG